MADWVRVGSADECPPGGVLGVVQNGHRIVVANVDGDLYALEDRCSHQDFPLSDGELDGFRLECVFHGATFDVRTGKALSLPAIRPVRSYPLELRESDIYVQVD